MVGIQHVRPQVFTTTGPVWVWEQLMRMSAMPRPSLARALRMGRVTSGDTYQIEGDQ